ncbi:MAG: ArsR family transcriptional regulator [Chloroflexi bacterium]|nr:MAG: ArsR family transcriptional regulator [Chloroflexota bacterium]
MARDKESTLLLFFQAVGQPERLKMLGMMANRPHTVLEIATSLGIKKTAVQHHLTRLQAMDLIIENSQLINCTYQLNSEALERLEQLVNEDHITKA